MRHLIITVALLAFTVFVYGLVQSWPSRMPADRFAPDSRASVGGFYK